MGDCWVETSGAEAGEENTGFQLPEQDSLNFVPGVCGTDQPRLLPRVGSKVTSTSRSQVHLQGPTNLCDMAGVHLTLHVWEVFFSVIKHRFYQGWG